MVGVKALSFVKTLSKSIDARNKRQFFYEVSVVVGVLMFKNPEGLQVYLERPKADRRLTALPTGPSSSVSAQREYLPHLNSSNTGSNP